MVRVYKQALPAVTAELDRWLEDARRIPDPELRQQAIASIETKRFHCIGGSMYALMRPAQRGALVPLIVALQTISDYLDNLCDRSTSLDAEDFRQLHLSMHDAVDPDAPPRDYYALRAERDDGGYLRRLVETCQANARRLPSYRAVQRYVGELVGLYADLQVHKHIHRDEREAALLTWWGAHRATCPELGWNEFAAATGSTLGMFHLFAAAADDALDDERARSVRDSYFPYVCGLHILLDYLIDREEDRIGGDLNFCEYYEHETETAERIGWVAEQARSRVRQTADRRFHAMIVEGLLALYLSDPKVRRQPSVIAVTKRLMRGSPWTRLFFWANSVWIRKRQGIDRPQIQNARS
ncbi:tetraprenyl-beta-curcumene synthase family protein [Paenibacillus sp. TRM 82003]|nr:tetraprenyl-beta-curcumene synthase family protein [Paenibacillus sp. TRM 82003]